MGIQDNFWTIGEETVTWGTKATTLTPFFAACARVLAMLKSPL